MEEIPSTGLQVKDLLMKWSESNDLLKSIHFDINEDMCVGGILAIGIIHKVVTGPFWRLVETVPDALSLNTFHLTRDCVYESRMAPSEDLMHDTYSQIALELCFGGMLLILERQAKDQLPGSGFWNVNDETKEKLSFTHFNVSKLIIS
jgi:hypothetical protein